jgi:hypothetical protein
MNRTGFGLKNLPQ